MGDLAADLLSADVTEDVENMIDGENLTEIAQQINSDQGNSDIYSLSLERPSFTKFRTALVVIQDVCGDCDIRNGLLRCRSNDRKNLISIDFASILNNKNISFSGLKTKLNLLGCFELDMNVSGADNTIIIESTQDNFEFSDCFSKLVMRKPMANYLENKFIEDDDFRTLIGDSCREDNLLFSYSIDNYLKTRVATICNNFRCDSVIFEFHGNYAKLGTETKTKDNVLKNAQQINLNFALDGKRAVLNNLAFTLGISSGINISCYKCNEQHVMFKSDLVFFGIPVTIYSKNKFQDLSE